MLGEGPTPLGPDGGEKQSSSGLDGRGRGGAGRAGRLCWGHHATMESQALGVLAGGCCRGSTRRFSWAGGFCSCAFTEWVCLGHWGHGRTRAPAWALAQLERRVLGHLPFFPRRPDCLCPTRCFVLPVSVGTPAGRAPQGAQGLCEMVPEASPQGLSLGHAHRLVTYSGDSRAGLSGIILSFFTCIEATQNLYSDLQINSAQRKPVPKATPSSRIPQGKWAPHRKLLISGQRSPSGHVEVTGPGIQPLWPHLPGRLCTR